MKYAEITAAIASYNDDTLQTAIVDLITDALLYAREEGQDVAAIIRMATGHFEEEAEPEPRNMWDTEEENGTDYLEDAHENPESAWHTAEEECNPGCPYCAEKRRDAQQ